MSNIIHKVKDAITDHGDKHHDSTKSSNYGPHDSNLANAADPRIDSDRSNVGSHTTATTGPSSTQPLAAGSNPYESARSSNHGPHDSNIANKVDPRVDSDRDNRAAYGTQTTGSTGLGSHTTSTGVGSTGLATGTGANAYDSTRSSNHGPHDSNIANKVDPRVDSDRDNRAAYGTQATGNSGLGLGTGAATGAAAGAAYGHHESQRSSNHGPHDSNLANKADPRVDSDRDNLAAYGSHSTSTGLGSNTTAGTGSTGLTGHHSAMGDATQQGATHSTATGPASSTAGPHENNLANKADPRVDSDLSNETSGRFANDVHKGSLGGAGVIPISGNAGPTSTKTFEEAQQAGGAGAGSSYNTTGSGFENKNTAGPHKSDLANKLDPRVDSDLDGSKTIGSQRV